MTERKRPVTPTQRLEPPVPPARKSGAFLWTADDGPPLAFEEYPPAEPEDEPAPRAMRPIGQLGGSESAGFALARPEEIRPSLPFVARPGRIADDDDVPEEDLPPTLPPRLVGAEPATRHLGEAERLEAWLLSLLAQGVPEPTEAEKLELWLLSLDMAETAALERRRP